MVLLSCDTYEYCIADSFQPPFKGASYLLVKMHSPISCTLMGQEIVCVAASELYIFRAQLRWGCALFYYQTEKGEKPMNAIVCELCGSNDVIKQDGFMYVNTVARNTLLKRQKTAWHCYDR